jgi:hypothetical protein
MPDITVKLSANPTNAIAFEIVLKVAFGARNTK